MCCGVVLHSGPGHSRGYIGKLNPTSGEIEHYFMQEQPCYRVCNQSPYPPLCGEAHLPAELLALMTCRMTSRKKYLPARIQHVS
jgi:hypothetical protein